jgi:hypothetical protein
MKTKYKLAISFHLGLITCSSIDETKYKFSVSFHLGLITSSSIDQTKYKFSISFHLGLITCSSIDQTKYKLSISFHLGLITCSSIDEKLPQFLLSVHLAIWGILRLWFPIEWMEIWTQFSSFPSIDKTWGWLHSLKNMTPLLLLKNSWFLALEKSDDDWKCRLFGPLWYLLRWLREGRLLVSWCPKFS